MNTFPIAQVEIGPYLLNPGEFATMSTFLSLISAFAPMLYRFSLQKAAQLSDQIIQLMNSTEDLTWQQHAGYWWLT